MPASEMRADSQWPRWEVFQQVSSGKPHQAVGSVHAADAEHALLTARTVFGRRPKAVGMWVAPAAAVMSATEEQFATAGWSLPDEPGDAPVTWRVFVKRGHRPAMTFVDHVGAVDAASPAEALALARSEFGEAVTWWLVPDAAFVETDPDAAPAWFDPALAKTYKQQSFYGRMKAREIDAGAVDGAVDGAAGGGDAAAADTEPARSEPSVWPSAAEIGAGPWRDEGTAGDATGGAHRDGKSATKKEATP